MWISQLGHISYLYSISTAGANQDHSLHNSQTAISFVLGAKNELFFSLTGRRQILPSIIIQFNSILSQ